VIGSWPSPRKRPRACGTPRYGIKGGFPYRGGCLPKDVEALLAVGRAAGLELPLLEAVIRVNDAMAKLGLSNQQNAERPAS
jgi:UDP-glucose 6-dehydrogenase